MFIIQERKVKIWSCRKAPPVPKPPKKDAAYIPISKERGFTQRIDKLFSKDPYHASLQFIGSHADYDHL